MPSATKTILPICAIALVTGVGCARKTIDWTAALARAHSMHGIQRFEFSPSGTAIQLTKDDAFFVIPVSGQFKWHKVRVTFDSLDSIRAGQLFVGRPDSGFSEALVVNGALNTRARKIDFILPRDKFTGLRLDLDIDTPTAQVMIRRFEVVPFAVYDYRVSQHALVYLFALIFALATIGPGFFLSLLIGRSKSETSPGWHRGDFFFLFSIFFYFA